MSDEICKSGYTGGGGPEEISGGDGDSFYDSDYPDCGDCGECEICEQLEYRYTWKADGGENMCDHCVKLDDTQYKSLGDAPEKPHPNCNCMLEENDGFDRRRIIPHPWTGRDAPQTIWGDNIFINQAGERSVHPGWDSLYNRERFSPAGMERLREYERNLEQDRQRIEQARRRIITRERARRASGQTAAATPFQRAVQAPSRVPSRITALQIPIMPSPAVQPPAENNNINIPKNTPNAQGVQNLDIRWGTGEYGAVRLNPDRSIREFPHAGIDILMQPGYTIYALADGVVDSIGHSQNYGDNDIINVRHRDGTIWRYYYADSNVSPGDTIAQGHPIGILRDMSHRYRRTPSHLHFEIRVGVPQPGGRPSAVASWGPSINPINILRQYGHIF